MPSCLGLYIEDNLIKYAKVSKSNENIKIESFGVKFYENLETAVKQVIEETYSFKTPISINSADEWYNKIDVFNLLSKKDMENVIKTEFENICYIKEINKNIYEQRYVFTNSNVGEDKIKTIHMAIPKSFIEQRKNQFSEYRISSIVPVGVVISNLVKKERKGTNLVVNIEKDTTITKITNGVVSDIQVLDFGAQDILRKISQKENSISKSYEICKNSTIYMEEDKDLQYDENEYLEDIMPTLFQIVSEVKKKINESVERIENVYITGTGAVVNNIDIYFQEYLKETHCEILKPGIINNNSKVNIKDYIEVNSAIAIAMQGLDKKDSGVNFKGESGIDRVAKVLTSDVSGVSYSEITNSIKEAFGKFSRQWDMLSMFIVIITIVYLGGATFINNQLEKKMEEVNQSISATNAKINDIKEKNDILVARRNQYLTMISNIQNLNDANTEDKRYKNTIPNLLNNIMTVIPKGVELVKIENKSDTHVVIEAKTPEFQQMAYFKTLLKEEGVLKDVISDTGISQDGYLIVTIEGELP